MARKKSGLARLFKIIFVDDLSVGTHPSTWLGQKKVKEVNGAEVYGNDERLVFLNTDFRF